MTFRPFRREFPGASAYVDRHGKRRWRYRAKGFSAELGTDYGSPEFMRRYEAARAGEKSEEGAGAQRTIPRSVSALIAQYYRSSEFKALAPSTKTTYRGILERFRENHGRKRVATLERRHIKALLAEKSETPSAANNLRDRLKTLLDLAIDLGWRTDNPVTTVRPLKTMSYGFHTWTEQEVKRYYATYPAGTLAHTAMTLMLYTGAARSDAVKLGWRNVSDGRIRYRRRKTERAVDVEIDIPIHPHLQAVLDTLPRTTFTFLETRAGKTRSPNGLGNMMREWCDAAGNPKCTSHGLRKAISRRLAEAGATPHEIMAVTGHRTFAEVVRYTADANRGTLATGAIAKLDKNER